jgi:hypothetical protein
MSLICNLVVLGYISKIPSKVKDKSLRVIDNHLPTVLGKVLLIGTPRQSRRSFLF